MSERVSDVRVRSTALAPTCPQGHRMGLTGGSAPYGYVCLVRPLDQVMCWRTPLMPTKAEALAAVPKDWIKGGNDE